MKRIILVLSDDELEADLRLPFEATSSAWLLSEALNQRLLHDAEHGTAEQGTAWAIMDGELGPEDIRCPACNAAPGKPCTAPTDTSRRPINWHHASRIDGW